MRPSFRAPAGALADAAATAAEAASGEQELRDGVERALGVSCRELGLPWADSPAADVAAHGALVLGFAPPHSFNAGRGRAAIAKARRSAAERAEALVAAEGRPPGSCAVVVCDGPHLCFGRFTERGPEWEPVAAFDRNRAARLLELLESDGLPLVHPQLLAQLVGPESPVGARLLPKLFDAVRKSAVDEGAGRTLPLFAEWRQMFGQVAGNRSRELRRLLAEQGREHDRCYAADPPAYLFALNTHIALVAKLVAAMALPGSADLAEVPVEDRVRDLESGRPFRDAGIADVLRGDFFGWYLDDPSWPDCAPDVAALVAALRGVNFDVRRKSPDSARDLFKGLYMEFVPRSLRHALGEYYTPDWLAAHALDRIGWDPGSGLGDPAAGSGTFLLEAVRRRAAANPDAGAHELLSGLWGLDLNPIAVLTARASLVVALAGRFDPQRPVRLPVHLADALNPASTVDDICEQLVRTEDGDRTFRLPTPVVEHESLHELLHRARELAAAGEPADALTVEFGLDGLGDEQRAALRETAESLAELQRRGWDELWCDLLAERFAAAAIPPGAVLAGNPPWVRCSDLPPRYAELVKQRCLELGLYRPDGWVGGIESDVSTVLTCQVLDRYLVPGGTLAFFITGTVFSNPSSRAFRRWRLDGPDVDVRVRLVEDFGDLAPFDGVSNHATMLVLTKGSGTTYPVNYRVWSGARQNFPSAAGFRAEATSTDLQARPVPGTDAGPWLKGTAEQHELWRHLFGAQEPAYQARKGVTTDANGVFFVQVDHGSRRGLVSVRNDPSNGRRAIPAVRGEVEAEHVYPLLRGKGVRAFAAEPDPVHRVLLPQSGMHGDPQLPEQAPRTHAWLSRFRSVLEARSSYRRFQLPHGAPFWSLWSTGAYTFSPFKVAWREMPNGRFAAGYTGSADDPVLGSRTVVPDHKLYFVACDSEDEAAYLTALLNAPLIAEAVSGYAAQLSLGASVVAYLLIPAFDATDPSHRALAALARALTAAGGTSSPEQLRELDRLAARVQGLPDQT